MGVGERDHETGHDRAASPLNEHADRFAALVVLRQRARCAAMLEWKDGHGWAQVFIGPDEEVFEALVLTLRLSCKSTS
jgi:hypothetical protein